MKTYRHILGIIFILALSCKSTNNYSDEQIKQLESIVENKNFTIESDWARPQVTYAMQQVLNSGILPPGSGSGAISLIGNANFLTISGDSINAYLPYFGERQMPTGYGGSDSAIQLKGKLKDYTFEIEKNNSYLILFDAQNETENFNISIVLFPNRKSEIRVNSASRFPISYSGEVLSVKTNNTI
jgi:hypothetical protein